MYLSAQATFMENSLRQQLQKNTFSTEKHNQITVASQILAQNCRF